MLVDVSGLQDVNPKAPSCFLSNLTIVWWKKDLKKKGGSESFELFNKLEPILYAMVPLFKSQHIRRLFSTSVGKVCDCTPPQACAINVASGIKPASKEAAVMVSECRSTASLETVSAAPKNRTAPGDHVLSVSKLWKNKLIMFHHLWL